MQAMRYASLLLPLLALCRCSSTATASGDGGELTTDATAASDGTSGTDARAGVDAGDSAALAADSGTTDTTDARTDSPASTGDAASCGATFTASLDKTCSVDSDCTTANHDDCCGTVVVGIRAGTQATFASAEQAFMTCELGCGGRGCDHATWAEIGQSSPDASTIVVECEAGACMTTFQ
jgi:hypothetical protein